MLWILAGVKSYVVPSKRMSDEIKVGKITHRNPPLFKIVHKIIYGLLGSHVLVVVVIRSATSTHSYEIYENKVVVLAKLLKSLIKE